MRLRGEDGEGEKQITSRWRCEAPPGGQRVQGIATVDYSGLQGAVAGGLAGRPLGRGAGARKTTGNG